MKDYVYDKKNIPLKTIGGGFKTKITRGNQCYLSQLTIISLYIVMIKQQLIHLLMHPVVYWKNNNTRLKMINNNITSSGWDSSGNALTEVINKHMYQRLITPILTFCTSLACSSDSLSQHVQVK